MAKVTAPLFSASARGQIMKSLVYFPWKAIKAVRSYVIPANPNTAGQQAQRSKMTDAVNEWHTSGIADADRTAWNRFASTLAKVMSGFNAFVRSYIDALVAGDTWTSVVFSSYEAPGATTQDINLSVDEDGSYKLYWGTSPTYMPNSDTQASAEGALQVTAASLTDGVIYYWYVEDNIASFTGRTGVFKFTHDAP